MRSLRPSLDATLRAAIAVQIGCPADLSRLSFCRQRARAPSTIATAMLSVAGTRWRHKSARADLAKDARRVCAMEDAHQKSCAIIASPDEKSGLRIRLREKC